jgi:hypothetical protein
MNSRNREWPVGFKGLVGIVSCVIGLSVVYFGYGIGTESPKKNATAKPSPAAAQDRKRPVRTMNMALGNMVFFARDLGFGVNGAKGGVADSDKIAARIEGQLREIRELYRQEIVKNPSLAGGLTLQFNIAPSGEVSQVRELSSRLNDGEFKRAVVAAASKWSFADIAEEHLQVSCPLLFVHEGMDITTLVQWEKFLGHAGEKLILARLAGNVAQAQPVAVAAGAAAGKSHGKEFQIKYATSLRKGPNFSSASLATFPIGTKVNVLQRQGDWLEVRSGNNGPTGFVRKEFVATVEGARR